MHNWDTDATVIIPRHNPVRRSTLMEILRQAGLSPEEFNGLV